MLITTETVKNSFYKNSHSKLLLFAFGDPRFCHHFQEESEKPYSNVPKRDFLPEFVYNQFYKFSSLPTHNRILYNNSLCMTLRVLSWTKSQVNYRTALHTNRNLSTPDNFKNYSPLPLTCHLWFKPGKTRLTLYDKQISVINPLVINQVPKVAQLARTLRVSISE